MPLLAAFGFFGISQPGQADETSFSGYVNDVSIEKNERYIEIYLYAPPKNLEPSLQEKIFSPLANEFKQKYRENFGQLDTESIQYLNAFHQLDENRGASVQIQTENNTRKIFAEYMTRRLFEYHFDHYMKTKPEMRPVLEVKEKIQNVKVEVTKEVRLNIQYNFAANIVDLVMDNPYCDSKYSLEMNPRAFGPSNILESYLRLGKNLSKTVRVNSNASTTDGIVYADISKSFARWYLGTFVGIQAAYKGGGTTPRETKYLIGFSHSY